MLKLTPLLLALLLLPSCTHKPLSAETQAKVDVVSAASFLGDEFVVDVIKHSLLRKDERVLSVEDWKVDEAFRAALAEGVSARKREFRALELDAAAVQKALGLRESRWKRVIGKHNQALMELLFTQAERQGVHYFFLVGPMERHDNYPLHAGSMGVFCYDRKLRHSKAAPYFVFDFSLWDVAKRKKVFTTSVDPGVTQSLTFAECEAVAQMKEPKQELEGPVKQAIGIVVDGLFQKMGWGSVTPAASRP